ncbi:MAG: hypothetical protein V4548_13745 [Bacteroidota bacterium]
MSLFLVSEIFYLSWLPNGHLGKETHLPTWLLNWSNTYFNLRTAIPFIPLGYLLEAWASIPTKIFVTKKSFPLRIKTTLIATVIICLAEGGQFFIANRNPDSLDIVFGIMGSSCGSIIHYCIKNLTKSFFIKHA